MHCLTLVGTRHTYLLTVAESNLKSATIPHSAFTEATFMQAHPIHMWDAAEGGLRCTYRAYDAADEITAATSIAFSPEGGELYGGFNKCIRVWDTSRPGRDCSEIVTHQKKAEGLPGTFCSQLNCFTTRSKTIENAGPTAMTTTSDRTAQPGCQACCPTLINGLIWNQSDPATVQASSLAWPSTVIRKA